MRIRLLLAAFILACAPVPNVDETDPASSSGVVELSAGSMSTTGAESAGSTGSTGDDASTGGGASTDDSSTSGSTGDTSTTGAVDSGEVGSSSSSSGEAPGFCGDGFVDEGEECDDGNDDETDACLSTCVAAKCGDGVVEAGVEECDDGANSDLEDGCSPTCEVTVRWEHYGMATDVNPADLLYWKPCFKELWNYNGPIATMQNACTGDHILVACRKVGEPNLRIAAHAPRADVWPAKEDNYKLGMRRDVNGSSWYYAPSLVNGQYMGYGPLGSTGMMYEDANGMAVIGKDANFAGGAGGRCGDKVGFNLFELDQWEHLYFEAFD